jgi:bifunctional non-homologous end joining protein LigD
MPLRSAPEPFDSPAYLFETRWGGIRALAFIEAGRVQIRNGRQGNVTDRFPELRDLRNSAVEQPLLLDGEIIIVDAHGHCELDLLQHRLRLIDPGLIAQAAADRPACFLATDVLFRGQQWLLGEPLSRRKRLLADAVHKSDTVFLAETFEADGRALFEAALESELDGIIAKPLGGPYTPGLPGGGWLAIAHDHQDLVIAGYSLNISGGSRQVELLAGAYQDGRLLYTASVHPPDDEALSTELFAVLNALQVNACPFATAPPIIACWVSPEVVVTISHRDRRALRVRLDVTPQECLLAGDTLVSAQDPPPSPRPLLTLLSTLALPFEPQSPSAPGRPNLMVVGENNG